MAAGAAFFVASGVSGPSLFMPHAHCYLFNRQLMMLHGGSDLFIGLSYTAISATLIYLVVRARRELPFHWMMLAFAVFIVACGATHFMELWTLQAEHPRYWLSGWVKLLTATASLITALLLPPLVPKIRAVLGATRLASERKTELEKAYAELKELYEKALVAAAPRTEKKEEEQEQKLKQEQAGEPMRDLAQMAKEVTVHARELERAKQEAEEANLAKDQFLAVLSHELRTPLTPALAAACHLEDAPNLDPQALRESLALIRRNIELEARLVDDLLDITRINKGKLQVHFAATDLHQTIRHAVDMCRSAANHVHAAIVLELEATERYVQGDGARLAQVFWNLILNAVKFTSAENRITIRTTNPAPGRVRVEVVDRGIGIDPEMLQRIFDPFQRGEHAHTRRYGGMGLGLSIAKGLVEAHGGSIAARSEGKDRGATFAIELSTVVAPVMPESTGLALPAATAQRSLRILLVEDHVDTRHAMERLLTRWGHFVKTAATVAEGVEMAAAFAPELLLSDLGLPDGTGIELLGKVRAEREILAIAMSGYGMESDLEQTAQAGFAAHLVKPVAAERLKEVIERVAVGGSKVES
jgi:signal transduction histidine kinase/CheY-like chemotaxis protein